MIEAIYYYTDLKIPGDILLEYIYCRAFQNIY